MITHKEILALKPQTSEKRYSAERGGLYISVSPSAGRYWYYRYKFEGITAWYSLGTFNHPTTNKDVKVVMDLKSALKQFYFEKSGLLMALISNYFVFSKEKRNLIKHLLLMISTKIGKI